MGSILHHKSKSRKRGLSPFSNEYKDSKRLWAKLLALLFLFLLIGYILWSYYRGGIVAIILKDDITTAERLFQLRCFFKAWGNLGPFIYMVIVIIEVVVVPIPGSLLYAPGGVIFGGFVGGTMSLLGNVLGAGISFQVTRILGRTFIECKLEASSLRKYESILKKRGAWIVFLLRVNPFTSSDLVSYAAGLTPMPVWKVMVGTFFGMLPLCYVQAYFAKELFTAIPLLIYPFFFLCIVYAFAVVWIVWRIKTKKGESNE